MQPFPLWVDKIISIQSYLFVVPGLQMDTVTNVRLVMPDGLLNTTSKGVAQGRVEVEVMGIWGTICGDYWDINDGHVICK